MEMAVVLEFRTTGRGRAGAPLRPGFAWGRSRRARPPSFAAAPELWCAERAAPGRRAPGPAPALVAVQAVVVQPVVVQARRRPASGSRASRAVRRRRKPRPEAAAPEAAAAGSRRAAVRLCAPAPERQAVAALGPVVRTSQRDRATRASLRQSPWQARPSRPVVLRVAPAQVQVVAPSSTGACPFAHARTCAADV